MHVRIMHVCIMHVCMYFPEFEHYFDSAAPTKVSQIWETSKQVSLLEQVRSE